MAGKAKGERGSRRFIVAYDEIRSAEIHQRFKDMIESLEAQAEADPRVDASIRQQPAKQSDPRAKPE
jgi:hypothetical protein